MVERTRCLVVVDPAGLNADAYSQLLLSVRRAGSPLVLWSAKLTTMCAARVVAASEVVPTEVLFSEFDNRSRLLRALVRTEPAPTASALILRYLAPLSPRLHPEIRVKLVGLFGGAPVPPSSALFASQTCWGRRTVERDFRQAGIASVKRVLDAARAAAAWYWLQKLNVPLAQVASEAYFSSVRTLTAQFHDLAGLAPRQAVRNLSTHDFSERISARIIRRSAIEL